MDNYVFLGLPRSGSQAILQWVMSQIEDVNYYDGKHNSLEELGDGNNLIRFEGLGFSEFRNKDIPNAKTIAVFRNPWNAIASQTQWKIGTPLYKRRRQAINLWTDYYSEYIKKESDVIFIIYDKWFVDKKYRKEISNKLGLKFSDEKFESVPNAGRGSSFDGIKYDGRAQEMNVLNRYKQVDNYSMNIFKESEIGQELKNKWNHLCDLENIKKLKIK
jgi:hypothetical protein